MENPTTVRKIRIFFYCVKKTLLVNYFQKYTFKVPASSHFCETWESSKYSSINQDGRWIYPKLYIFNTPVQKEGNLPGFHIYTVCNLLLGHSSELKFILNQIRFVYFSAVWKIQLSQFNLHVKFQRILEGHNSSRIRISQQTKGFKTRAMLWVYHI